MIDWRNRRIITYGEYLESIQILIRWRPELPHSTTTDAIDSFIKEYHENEALYSDIGQRVRLIASDEIVSTMKCHPITMQLPVPVVVRVPKPVLATPITPEEARIEAKADMKKVRNELQEHVTCAWAYYHELTHQMRADLGAAPLPRE